MLDQKNTPTTTADRVEESARKLWDRLNPAVRDREIPREASHLPIYDWEIASDTELELDAVRAALQNLDGRAVALQAVNDEHFVIGLNQTPVENVA